MKRLTNLLPILLLLVVFGCDDRVEETDQGGVALQLSTDPVAVIAGVNEAPAFLILVDEITLDNVIVRPDGTSSQLMDINMSTLEITYSRADTGTRVPPPYVLRISGIVPVGGTLTIDQTPILGRDQVLRPPISDLLFENGGFDAETGGGSIRINATIRAFGRTLGGEDVVSNATTLTVELVPSLVTNF